LICVIIRIAELYKIQIIYSEGISLGLRPITPSDLLDLLRMCIQEVSIHKNTIFIAHLVQEIAKVKLYVTISVLFVCLSVCLFDELLRIKVKLINKY